MQCDYEPGIWPSRVDFCRLVGNRVRRFQQAHFSLLVQCKFLKADARLHPVTSDVSGNCGMRRHTANLPWPSRSADAHHGTLLTSNLPGRLRQKISVAFV